MFHLPQPTGLARRVTSPEPVQEARPADPETESVPEATPASAASPPAPSTTAEEEEPPVDSSAPAARDESQANMSGAEADATSPPEEEVQSGKPDPGLQYLREINLTPEEDAHFASMARGWIPALVQYEASDEGWKLVSSMFGVKVWSMPKVDESESTSLVICRGQIPLTPDVTYDMVQTQFIKVFNTSEVLAQEMRASDPMSRETRILYQVPCEDNEFIRIVWGSFKAAGVAWARDFNFLQHACPTTDPATGDRLYCVVAGSIERPEVPDMEKLCKRIRSTVKTSGFVFREPKNGGPMRVTYVVNVNPNGWIPNAIVNIVCNNQAMNVSRVKNKLSDTAKALSALKIQAPIVPKAVGWRQSHEHAIARPAAGAGASNVSVKFSATSKASFRVQGVSATTDWKHDKGSSGVAKGEWVTYSANTPVTLTFKVQPETAAAAAAGGGGGGGGSGSAKPSDVELTEAGSGVVLEWKGAGWFKGFVVYHRVEVS